MITSKKGKDMITRAWKVNGVLGHRQRESFNKSYKWDFSKGDNIRIIEVDNSDKKCESELKGQITDGIFENSKVGFIEEINE